ncbi:hypothetical protein KM043_013631 [Ampulex compressa]|nr:hypothetical protein KM043_013631 [Ampulex compressa]
MVTSPKFAYRFSRESIPEARRSRGRHRRGIERKRQGRVRGRRESPERCPAEKEGHEELCTRRNFRAAVGLVMLENLKSIGEPGPCRSVCATQTSTQTPRLLARSIASPG